MASLKEDYFLNHIVKEVMMPYSLKNSLKKFKSNDFNYVFNRNTGFTATWGDTKEHNPEVAPFPMIMDMEITTICHGINTKYGRNKESKLESNPCGFCYKSNTYNGKYMPFETAKTIIDKLPKELTQIAFGTDASLIGNPDWYEIFKYAREKDFIPNVTVADIDDETAEKLASVCGATSVSWYGNKDICYGSVNALSNAGLKYVNIHCMISKETISQAYELISDIGSDERLSGLYAVVFLSLKRKGRGDKFHCLLQDEFTDLVNACEEKHINFGFDSCSGQKFLNSIKGTSRESQAVYCDKCESARMSYYINVDGLGYPCSFSEGIWKPIDVLHCNDFINDVWNNPTTQNFRELSLSNDCNCVCYRV